MTQGCGPQSQTDQHHPHAFRCTQNNEESLPQNNDKHTKTIMIMNNNEILNVSCAVNNDEKILRIKSERLKHQEGKSETTPTEQQGIEKKLFFVVLSCKAYAVTSLVCDTLKGICVSLHSLRDKVRCA